MERKTHEQRNGRKAGENDGIGGSASNIRLPHNYYPCQEIFGSEPDKLGEKWLDRPTPLTGKHLATSAGQGRPWLSVGWTRRVYGLAEAAWVLALARKATTAAASK